MHDLVNKECVTLEYHQLLKLCSAIDISINGTDVDSIERDAKSQSKRNVLFRAGRIGASVSM